METFRVALSGGFLKGDGSPAYPDFDLSPLTDNPRVEVGYVHAVDGVMPAAALNGYDALILLTSRFDATSVPPDDRLAIVARFGVGYDSVDVAACTAAGIALAITPDGVRRPVATSIMTFILALSHNLIAKDRLTRRGPQGWAERAGHMGVGLVGRTLGTLGVGNIGAEVFRLAKPFGLRHIAHDPYVDQGLASELGITLVSLDDLFRQADFLSVSCPLNAETRGIVNAERLALMKPTAYLINMSRGPVVDQAAITEALQNRTIAGAGLDVFEVEPTAADDPLMALDNAILTPHALCFTDQCFAGIGASDIAAVEAVMRGDVPDNVVNKEVLDTARFRARLARYRA